MLVLNGGAYYPKSKELDQVWIQSITEDDVIGFIPSATTRSKTSYFSFFKEKMSQYNLFNIVMIDLEEDWNRVRDCKVIYIAGGNTYQLLEIMNRSLFSDYLKKYHMHHIIVGNSAGCVVLGQTIQTSNDTNIVDLKEFDGLGLVNFSICPHYTPEKKHRLITLRHEMDQAIIGIPEGAGIVKAKSGDHEIGTVEVI